MFTVQKILRCARQHRVRACLRAGSGRHDQYNRRENPDLARNRLLGREPDMPYTLEKTSDPAQDNGLSNRWTLNFGPQHPATHTTLRLVLELDGERIVRCTPHIGYLHSGFEKLGEHLNYNQYVTIVDR